jgi:phosphoglycolate phosphatase-like HAD superfamily hydrolase
LGGKKLVVFWDIDGTLISIPKKSSQRHLEVVEQYTKKSLKKIGLNQGKTDIGIIKEIFEFNGIYFNRQDLQACLHSLNNRSKREITEFSNSINLGVENALDFCNELGVINSILTGNTRFRAIHKLTTINLISKFSLDLGFYGDKFFTREELVESAVKYAKKSKMQNIVLVGDTKLDIGAAQKNRVKIIAVSTGKESYRSLKRLKPDFILSNFSRDKTIFEEIIHKFI